MKYYTDYSKTQQLHVINFPENDFINLDILFEKEKTRDIKHYNITVLTFCDNEFNKMIKTQCIHNLIPSIELVEYSIEHLIDTIDNVSTEYVLFSMIKDSMIVGNLDDEFLNKFKTFNSDIVVAGISSSLFEDNLLNEEALLTIGNFKYINNGLLFGTKKGFLNLFKGLNQTKINDNVSFSKNELINFYLKLQLLMYFNLDKFSIDTTQKIFSTIMEKEYGIIEFEKDIIVDNNPLIFNKNKLL